MELRVPDGFVGLLKIIGNDLSRRVLELLIWASEHPAEAIAEAWNCLGEVGRYTLAVNLLDREGFEPLKSIEAAREADRRAREEEEFKERLRDALDKGGYKFRTPSGTECMVKRRYNGACDLAFSPGGEKVVFVYDVTHFNGISKIVMRAEKGILETPREIIYNSDRYSPSEEAGRRLMRAVEGNIPPSALTLLEE